MKRYYNKTQNDIPYIVTDFVGYINATSLHPGHYFPTKPWRSRRFAGFDCSETLVAIFKREDFNKLTRI